MIDFIYFYCAWHKYTNMECLSCLGKTFFEMYLVRMGDDNSSEEEGKRFHQSVLLWKSGTSETIISIQFPE